MNKRLAWILVSAAVVSVGMGVALRLGQFWGDHVHAPAHPNPLAVAAAPTVPAAIVPEADAPISIAPAEEELAPTAALQPHVDGDATTRPAEKEATPGSGTAAEVAPTGPVAVNVWELVSAGADYAGREVILTGRILNLCVRGCQLSLDDGTGVMPVELVDDALSNTVPLRSTGRRIEITGIFRLTPRPHVSVERPDGWRFP